MAGGTLALARGLVARGHRAFVATSPFYGPLVEEHGAGFPPLRPDVPTRGARPEFAARRLDPWRGTEHIVRRLVLPFLRASHEDALAAIAGADRVGAGVLSYGARLAAERTGTPWASTPLQPSALVSAWDPAATELLPGGSLLRRLGPRAHRLFLGAVPRLAGRWFAPWRAFRAELGSSPAEPIPFLGGLLSPRLVLARFSPTIARPAPDWPPRTVVTGFPFDDGIGPGETPPEPERFLDAGPPPVVFTLGSAAVFHPGSFFAERVAAAKDLGRRAVLLVGPGERARLGGLPASAIAVDSVPRAAAAVHQGGIGTAAQALRAGRPMLIAPFAFDQPGSAARVRRWGVARVVPRRRYRARLVADESARLLDDPGYRDRAEQIGAAIRSEDGVGVARAAIERAIAGVAAAGAGERGPLGTAPAVDA